MQLLYSFTEVNFPAKGLNTLLAPSSLPPLHQPRPIYKETKDLLGTCWTPAAVHGHIHRAAEITLRAHEEASAACAKLLLFR